MKPDENALSESVSIILVISLILILFIVTAALLFGYMPLQQKAAMVMAEVGNDTLWVDSLHGITVFTIFHKAGDDLSLNQTYPSSHLLGIYIDNGTSKNRALPVIGLNTVRPGMTLYVYYNATKKYQITDTPAAIVPGVAQAIPDCPATVRLVDETAKIALGSWNWSCTPLPLTGPAPTVTGRSPASAPRGWPVTVTITGTNFLYGASAKLNLSLVTEIPSSSCTFASSTKINCTFSLPPNASAPSSQVYHLVVVNPDQKTGILRNTFTVTNPTLSVSGCTPGSGMQGTSVVITRISGTNFQQGATVLFHNGSTKIPLSDPTVLNATSITGTLNIPGDAPATYYNITVTNPDKRNATRASRVFTVTSNVPVISGMTNRTGYRGWTVVETITGANFVNGATARFSNTTLGSISAPCTYVSSTRLTCIFDLTGKPASPPGGYDVIVTNPASAGGKEGVRAAYFTLSSPSPTISSSTPSSAMTGDTITGLTIAGNYFQPPVTVTYWRGPPSAPTVTFPLSVTSVPTRSTITGTLAIPAGTPYGDYNITVTNVDGQSVTRRNGFHVYAGAFPTITPPLSNTSGARNTQVIVVLTGTNIQPGARISLYNSTRLVYTAPPGTVTPPTTIKTIFTVPVTVLPETMNVRVTNPDNGYVVLTGGYKVT